MKYQLCLKPGAYTPSFVYADGARPFETRVTNPHRANVGDAVKLPIPWDPIYERDFSHIIQQLGEHYASDPLCVSVVLTCANFMSAEMHLPKTRQDLSRWQALGDYEARLLEVYKKFVEIWGAAFPKQEISLHVSKVLDLPPSFYERVVDAGLSEYPERFSIQNCQLTGRKEDAGMMSYDLVQKYRDRAHHGFQSLAGLSHPKKGWARSKWRRSTWSTAAANTGSSGTGTALALKRPALSPRFGRKRRNLGYEAYKKKLISEGKYRQQR